MLDEASEWKEAGDDTKHLVRPGAHLILDEVSAQTVGLQGNKRNLGYTSADGEVEVVGIYLDPTSTTLKPTLHFKHFIPKGRPVQRGTS